MTTTVAQALHAAQRHGVARLDARALLAAVLARPPAWLLAHDDAVLDAAAAARYDALLGRRGEGEPLAYLLGEKEFYGLLLQVTPAVLVPRPDTETLVEWALEVLPAGASEPVLDLGTGSGAIALALAAQRPAARITAVDASPAALAVARANGERLNLRVQWLLSDWFAALAGRRFGLIVANPPYIAEGDRHLMALKHEPRQALTSGADGMDAIRHIIDTAPACLSSEGWLLMEHGQEQSEAVAHLLHSSFWIDVVTRKDLAGRPRCTGARRPR